MVLQHDGDGKGDVVAFQFIDLSVDLLLGVGTAILGADAHHDTKRRFAQHVFAVIFHAVGEARLALFRRDVRHADAVATHGLRCQAHAQGVVDSLGGNGFV